MNTHIPLAEKLRPENIDQIVGQNHLVGKEGVVRKLLAAGFLPSMILWGPPGVGKTTLAKTLADTIDAYFESKSAVTSGLDEIRKILKLGEERKEQKDKPTVLFVDEIHRFNKAQQDALLPYVERGSVILIGATTENPSFEVINPLLSRCRVYVLNQLSDEELNTIIDRGLKLLNKKIENEAKEILKRFANGDARQVLTILEIAGELALDRKIITKQEIEEASQRKSLAYDQNGEEHYNTISAFIKSMRASQVDAALYYLARMVESGEDPLFIARRMMIFAAEDIGVALPTALVVANAVFDGCHKVGYPEAQILLAQGVVYLASAKKDRSAYDAYFAALADAKNLGNLPIPLKVRNAPTKLMKSLEYGKGYEMYSQESYLPEKIAHKKYFKSKS